MQTMANDRMSTAAADISAHHLDLCRKDVAEVVTKLFEDVVDKGEILSAEVLIEAVMIRVADHTLQAVEQAYACAD
jgi:hypothetical protein